MILFFVNKSYHSWCRVELFEVYIKQKKAELELDWLKNQNEMFCFMKIQSHLIKTASVFCLISFHKKKSDSISSHWKKIWFCLISWKKNLILSHLTEKNSILSHLTEKKSDSVSFHEKKIWFCLISSKKTDSVLFHQKKISFHPGFVLNQNQNETENPDFSSQYIV